METICNKNYVKDIYGNLHQKISYNNYGKILDFYKKHIYLGGKFYKNSTLDKNIININLAKKDIAKSIDYADIFDNMLQQDISKKSILELGCGIGSFLNVIQDKYQNYNCAGWDISEKAQYTANTMWGENKVDIKEMEILRHINYLEPNSKWDIVIAFDFIEHIRYDKLLLNNLKFLLNTKGICLVEVPVFSTDNIHNLIKAPYLYTEHHLHLYSYEGFSLLANECGWNIKKMITIDDSKKAFYLMELK